MTHLSTCTVPSVVGVSDLSVVDLDSVTAGVVVFALRRRPSFRLPRFNLESLDVRWIKQYQDIAQEESIEFLGPRAEREIRMLRMFHEVGQEFLKGASSLRDIAETFEKRECAGLHPMELASTLTSISRECKYAKQSFGRRFNLDGEAELFVSQGERYPITGLTPLGHRAWYMTRHFLIRLKVIS